MICRYNITPQSPVITPFMSDTFFGHFCWALRYQKGESFLENFLNTYGDGKAAPVLFSSAFPLGYLPRPTLPPPDRDTMRNFVREHFGESRQDIFQGLSRVKKWNKQQFIPLDLWAELRDDYTAVRLYEHFFKKEAASDDEKDIPDGGRHFVEDVTTSNRISRLQGTVQEGGLFEREKRWYYEKIFLDKQPPELPARNVSEKRWRYERVTLDLYAEINDPAMGGLVDQFLLEFLPHYGFGADKSVGMGSLDIWKAKSLSPECLSDQDCNARMSLSLASFSGIEAYDAFYSLKTKFGRLGGHFAFSSPTGGNPRPFKKPVLMYEPGAVFFCDHSLSSKPLLD